MSHLENLDSIREQQHSVVCSGRLRDIHVRRERLDVLYRTMKKWEPQLLEALKTDLGKSAFEGYSTELGVVYRERPPAYQTDDRPRALYAGKDAGLDKPTGRPYTENAEKDRR